MTSGTVTTSSDNDARSIRVLLITTFAFLVCFAIWMMFGVIGIPIRKQLGLNASEFGLLTATPVLTGAIFRLPLGIYTDRFGGRIVMVVLLLVCVAPLWLASYATELWQFLLLGLAIGLLGASFSVGTPYTARFFRKERRGFAMGVFGAGTAGAAINMFVAPTLVERYGWQSVPRAYAVVLLATAVLFWFLSAPDSDAPGRSVPVRQQLAVLKDRRVWRYCQYYSLVFGGFTALSIWMPQYYVGEYKLPIVEASLLAACFSLPGGVLRAVGGWMADRFGAHEVTWWVLWAAWVCLFLLSYPQTAFTVQTTHGPMTFHLGAPVWLATGLLSILAVALAFGMASTFKYISDDFPSNMGIVSGVVGMAGGLGGFFLPVMFGFALDRWGVNSSCFMLLYGITSASLVLMYFTEIRHIKVLAPPAPPAHVEVTGSVVHRELRPKLVQR